MTLRGRVERLERRFGPASVVPTIVALDLPDGQPDMVAIKGEWQPVSDGRTLLRELAGHPVTVIAGIDPKVVVGESNERQ